MTERNQYSFRNSPRLCCLLLTGLVGAATVPAFSASLSVTIRDQHDVAVAARVYLTDATNKSFFPKDTIVYEKTSAEGISEKDFVPPHGAFSVDLPAGKYRLVVERGKEYVPVDISLDVLDNSHINRTITLHRWVDMAMRGWFSGDMHLHRQLDDIPALMEAEDLAITMPITRWNDNRAGAVKHIYEAPDLQRYLSQADAEGFIHLKGGRFFSVMNEELEPSASALLASNLGKDKADLSYPLSRFGHVVQAAGGVSDSEKASSLEVSALAAVGACQTVGLANNHLWRSGSYHLPWGAWPDRMIGSYPQTCSGFVQAGFDMYSAMLNMGFPLKLSAGTASGVHPVPPGWSRIYVRTKAPLTPHAWFDALKEGKSFVTTGPMLLLRVNGKEPGEEVHADQFPMHLHASVEVLSLTSLSEAQIVVNGVAHKVSLHPYPKQPHSYRGSLDLTVTSSTWVAARWSAELPVGCGAAHSSPIYFWRGKQPILIKRAEAEILLDRVNKLIQQVEKGDHSGNIATDSAEIRHDTLKYFQKARSVYQRKLHDSSLPDSER